METVLGLLAFAVYVVVIVGIAAAVTWLVVRLTPSRGGSDGSARS